MLRRGEPTRRGGMGGSSWRWRWRRALWEDVRRGSAGAAGRAAAGWCWGDDMGETGACLREGGRAAGMGSEEKRRRRTLRRLRINRHGGWRFQLSAAGWCLSAEYLEHNISRRVLFLFRGRAGPAAAAGLLLNIHCSPPQESHAESGCPTRRTASIQPILGALSSRSAARPPSLPDLGCARLHRARIQITQIPISDPISP